MDYSKALATLQSSDPILGQVIQQVGSCTLDQSQGSGDLLTALTTSILHQQLSGKAAATIHRRFLELFPGSEPPTAVAILSTSDDQLRSTGISRAKVGYLKDLAQKVVDGLPSLAELETMDDETIIQTLIPIKGIGRWTVQMLLMFRLHRWDVLPVDDLGIRSGMRKVYELAELPDKKTAEAIGRPWHPYRSIGSWYMWRSLEI